MSTKSKIGNICGCGAGLVLTTCLSPTSMATVQSVAEETVPNKQSVADKTLPDKLKSCNTQDKLEQSLTKAISNFKLREMLTKYGVPEDGEVTLELYLGEDSKPVISCEVPTTAKKDQIQSGSISLESFKRLVQDDFINPAINTLDLGRLIPDENRNLANGKSPMKVAFRSSSESFSLDVVTALFCCQRDDEGNCTCYCSS